MSTTGATLARPKNEIVLPYPHPGQRVVRSQAKRFNWLSAGRRWRKTTLVMAIAVEAAISGKRIVWGAPVFDQVRIGWTEAKRAASGVAEFNISRMTATFPNNGVIVFRSLDDPDNARGYTADGVVIDECGEVKGEAWHEVLRPMLLDTNGWAWGMGTPKGHNWFWAEHEKAQDRDDTVAWQAPTLGARILDGQLVRQPHPLENPHVSFDEMLKLHETMPELTFRQEILADFVESSGGVFRGVREAAVADAQGEALEGHAYLVGCDWGKHQDFTVLAVLDATARSLVHLDRFNKIDYAIQVGRLKALCGRFKPTSVIAESNAMGEPLIEQLRRDGLPVQPFLTTNASKQLAIDGLSLAFEKGDIKIVPHPVLVSELQAFQAQRLPSGMLRYSAPEGMHDDTVMALALAWQGIGRRIPAWWTEKANA